MRLQHPPQRQPTPGQGQYAPPPQSTGLRGPVTGQSPPPPPGSGQFNRAPPPPLGHHGSPGAPPHGPVPRAQPPPSAGPYSPGPNAQLVQAPPPPSGPYAHQQRLGPSHSPQPHLHQQQPPPPGPPQAQGPPPPGGLAGAPPTAASRSSAPPARAQPPASKYRMSSLFIISRVRGCSFGFVPAAGDRGHIPDYAKPAYESITRHLNPVKLTTPMSIGS